MTRGPASSSATIAEDAVFEPVIFGVGGLDYIGEVVVWAPTD